MAQAEDALSGDAEITPLQALWIYQSQIENGGHHQFFWNWNDRPMVHDAAAEGARQIGLPALAALIEDATSVWRTRPRHTSANAVAYIESSRAGEFDAHDERYDDLEVELREAFEAAIHTLTET